MAHVVRVGEGADKDLAIAVVPPAQDHAPVVKGGIPRDGGDAGRAGFAREEGCVERARDEKPEGAAAEGVFAADEDRCFVDGRGQATVWL